MKGRKDRLYVRNGGILCFRYKDRKDGIWKEKSTKQTDRDKARDFKKDWDRRNEDGTLPTDKAEWTIEQACTLWVEQHRASLKSPKARRNEKSYLRQLVRRVGPKKLKLINLDTLKNYQSARSEEVGERPINCELAILVSALKEANLWRGTLTCYKRLIEPQSEAGQALTIEQLCRLETAAASRDAWEVAFCAELIAANTGMRGGEIKKLRLGMIDLENRRVRITRAITKSDAGARLVALNRSATEAMCRLYRRAQMLGASAPDDYLLPADLSRHTKSTDPLKGLRGFDPTRPQASWDTAWRNLREAAGLHGLGFHSLRHTFVTMMAQRGVPLPVVRAMVGHMSDAVTRLYTHISEGDARKAVEQLDGVRDSRDFVDAFVDGRRDAIESNAKLLN